MTQRVPGGQHSGEPFTVHAAELGQHVDLPPSTNGMQVKVELAQHSPLQHCTVLLQQKPPQQRWEVDEHGLVLEHVVTDVSAAHARPRRQRTGRWVRKRAEALG